MSATVTSALVLAAGGYALGRAHAETTVNASAVEPATNIQTVTTSSLSSVVAETIPPTLVATTTAVTPEPPPTSVASPKEPKYSFPLQPATVATYGPSHHDYPAADIFAKCGTEVVAPYPGVVQDVSYQDRWSSSRDAPDSRGGLSFSVVGDDGVRYYGSHLGSFDPAVRPDARVESGQRIGTVGDSGNAKGTGCHLHFGISTPCGPGDVLRRRGEFWPQGYLDAWYEGAQKSPADLPNPSVC